VPEARVRELQQAISGAVSATHDAAVIESCVLAVERLTPQLELLRHSIAHLDRRIAELTSAHPDQPIFDSLPGAGEVMVPRLIAAFEPGASASAAPPDAVLCRHRTGYGE